MNAHIVDSCGWLEYLADGPNAGFFAKAIEDTRHLIVPAICIYEVFKVVCRQRGEEDALQAVALMYQGNVVAIDETLALSAAQLGMQLNLPMADSIILAVARARKAQIFTQDADFKSIHGIRFIEKKK